MPHSQINSVLLVCDFSMLAALLQDKLRDCGVQSVDVIDRLGGAILAAEQRRYELALIDVNLNSEWQWTAADAIAARGLSVAFVAAGEWMIHALDFVLHASCRSHSAWPMSAVCCRRSDRAATRSPDGSGHPASDRCVLLHQESHLLPWP